MDVTALRECQATFSVTCAGKRLVLGRNDHVGSAPACGDFTEDGKITAVRAKDDHLAVGAPGSADEIGVGQFTNPAGQAAASGKSCQELSTLGDIQEPLADRVW